MLEPTAIHNYDAPVYRHSPPPPCQGPPPSLPFSCVVLENTGSPGGPSAALLHALRAHGCRLVLLLTHDDTEQLFSAARRPSSPQPAETSDRAEKSTPLHEAWYEAVFDKVISSPSDPMDTLDKYLQSIGVPASKLLCFCSSAAGVHICDAADAGLIIAPSYDLVCKGADVASRFSPTARQLAWLHEVFLEKTWCTNLWLEPPPGELASVRGDAPSGEERADVTAVASALVSAKGHPCWVPCPSSEGACHVRIGNKIVQCPDWTPLEPTINGVHVRDFPKLAMYLHTLDVGVAQVSWTLEVEDEEGVRTRIFSRRFINQARGTQAATEVSVSILSAPKGSMPELRVRSSILLDVPRHYFITHKNVAGASLTVGMADKRNGATVQMVAMHRFLKDEGRGDEEVTATIGDPEGAVETYLEIVHEEGRVAVDCVFKNPRPRARYWVEKVVEFSMQADPVSPLRRRETTAGSGKISPTEEIHGPPSCRLRRHAAPSFILNPRRSSSSRPDPGGKKQHFQCTRAASIHHAMDTPPSLAETEEEHRFAWKQEWDKVDVEISGQRSAIRSQRALRVFRFHQAAAGDMVGAGNSEPVVPDKVAEQFRVEFAKTGGHHRPSCLIRQRLILVRAGSPLSVSSDPPTQPAIPVSSYPSPTAELVYPSVNVRIEPSIPPQWERLRFNAALGGRWYRFTLTAGVVRILMQSPLLHQQCVRDCDIPRRPIFRIGSDGGEGVEVQASPWREVHVRYALTHLGRPDGTTGGFYGLMRRTRFLRLEIVRRLFADDRGDYRDPDLTQPLRCALAELESVPRPPRWTETDGAHRHILVADQTTRAVVQLAYEKEELRRDIIFLDSGEKALLDHLKERHSQKFPPGQKWVDGKDVPTFEDCVHETMETLWGATQSDQESIHGVFRNFITDRDGTTNNYCDRYASSVQSAYNAAWLAHFAKNCTDNSVVVTAAPLGGRPSAEGLLELSVTPASVVTYTGSKGREYFDNRMQRVRESEHLPSAARELIDEMHHRLMALCQEPYNTKFLGLGSGLQRKFGEVTMARNDPAGTVPEPESWRFMAAVRTIKDELDPDGSLLDIHDTGTDIEIFARISGRSFDKGSGVVCLNKKLRLRVDDGPNLVCGDTASDVAMLDATVRLMRSSKDSIGRTPPDSQEVDLDVSPTISPALPPQGASKLAAVFVISPAQHARTPDLAARVRNLCAEVGGKCAIVPSPDVLVASLAHFANQVMGNRVTDDQDYKSPLLKEESMQDSMSLAQIYCQ
eukprot:Hpha_TRINITY_DN16358_c1_g2::TRINITY_DN16358_c1_g2_i1::g.60291::m.60291